MNSDSVFQYKYFLPEDRAFFEQLYSAAIKGHLGKLTKLLDNYGKPKGEILKWHAHSDVSEITIIPNVVADKTAPLPYSHVVITQPTLIAVAIINGRLGVLNELISYAEDKDLLEEGNDCHEVNFRGEIEWRMKLVTPLMLACMLDKTKCIEPLLSAGAKPNARSSFGRTALHEACYQSNKFSAEICINYGADINAEDLEGVTPLMLSCAKGSEDLVKLLLAKGANTRQIDVAGRNALVYSIQSPNANIARQLIKFDRSCYVRNVDGWGAFLTACKMNRLDFVDFFISEADKLHLKYTSNMPECIYNECSYYGHNALHTAAEIGSVELFQKLISIGISPDKVDNEGRTPLMISCLVGNVDFVKFLIQCGDSISQKSARDLKHRNCIFYAVTNGAVDLIRYLETTAGVEFETTPSGLTLLMQAAGKGQLEVVNFLLQNRLHYAIEIDACDSDGWNAAMYATSVGDQDILKELVDEGIRFEITKDGKTLLMESAYHGHVHLVKYLTQLMAERQSSGDSTEDQLEWCDDDGFNAANYGLAGPNTDASLTVLEILQTEAGIEPVTSRKGVTPLMQVALQGNESLIKYVISNEPDMYAIDDEGANALNYAALGGSINTYRQLESYNIPKISDSAGRTVLMVAAACGHLNLVSYILENDLDNNLKNEVDLPNSRNALFYACGSGSVEVIAKISQYCDKNTVDRSGVTLLMYAAECGSGKIVEWLMSRYGTNGINSIDNEGRNVLYYALKSGNREMIERFLFEDRLTSGLNTIPEEGLPTLCQLLRKNLKNQWIFDKFDSMEVPLNAADSSGQSILGYAMAENLEFFKNYSQFYDVHSAAKYHKHGVTLLMQACASSMIEAARLLIQTSKNRGELLEAKDSQGRTALTYAVVSQNTKMVRLLVEKGSRLVVDTNGHSAVTHAIQSRNLRNAFLLMTSVLDIEPEIGSSRDNIDGFNLLHHCAKYGSNAELIKLIIARTKVDINAFTGHQGRTALMIAVANGNVSVVRTLIQLGCRVTTCDSLGKTALHVLFERENRGSKSFPTLSILEILLSTPQCSILLSEQDRDGKTALMMGSETKQYQAVFMMLVNGAQLSMKDNNGKTAIHYCGDETFRNFLELVKQPTQQAMELIQEFQPEICNALGIDELTEISDLIDCVFSHSSNFHPKFQNYIENDILTWRICDLLAASQKYRHLSSVIKSNLYENAEYSV